MAKNRPDKVIRLGYVSASIFSNEVENDGGTRTLHSVVIQKRYLEDGKPKYTSSFTLSELPLAVRALQLAQQWVEQQEAYLDLTD